MDRSCGFAHDLLALQRPIRKNQEPDTLNQGECGLGKIDCTLYFYKAKAKARAKKGQEQKEGTIWLQSPTMCGIPHQAF